MTSEISNVISAEARADSTATTPEKQSDSQTLMALWSTFLRWRNVIVGIVVASMLLGLIVTLLMTPQFTAKARIEISREEKKITNVEGLESQDAGRSLEFYNTQWSLLSARSLAERVARQLRLADNPAFFAAHKVEPKTDSPFFSSNAKVLTQNQRAKVDKQVVDLLLDHINIVPIRGSALVDVGYTSASPQVSAMIADAWARQFMAESMDRRMSSTVDARKFLELRLEDLRNKLESSERELAQFATDHNITMLSRTIGPDGKTQVDRTLLSADLEMLNSALLAATAERISAESRLQTVQKRGISGELIANQSIGRLRERRAELSAQYSKLLADFEPAYPPAVALRKQIGDLDASIAREEDRIFTSIRSDYENAKRKESELQTKVSELKGRYGVQQRDSIQYNIFQREVDTNRQLYDSLLQRYKEIGIAAVSANNISIVDSAIIPDQKSSPRLLVNLAISLLAGLAMAGLVLFGLARIDEKLRDPDKVAGQLGEPALGGIPDSDGPVLESLRDPKSETSEAYFSVYSNLSFSTQHGIPKSIMVTSARPAEGKSTSAVGLSAILGRTGKRVLLIDADMRSPSLVEYFGISSTHGLSNVLAGEDNWSSHCIDTGWPGVTLLPSGPIPPSASELLSGERLKWLISEAAAKFDCIVIDSPPVLELSDAPLILTAVEGAVYVVEAGGLPVRALRASLGRLHASQGHIFGVILTKVLSQNRAFGYGYGYGYGDRFNYGNEEGKDR